MLLENVKNYQSSVIDRVLSCSENLFLSRFLTYCGSVLSIAIALSISPSQAAEKIIDPTELEATFTSETPKVLSKTEFTQTSVQATDLQPESTIQPQAIAPTETTIAQTPQSEPEDRWRFSAEPYFFVPLDVSADVTAAGRSTNVRAGLGSVLNLDRAFDVGVRLEARKNNYGFNLDGFYLSAGQSGNIGVTFPAGTLTAVGIPVAARVTTDASVSIRQGTIDLTAFYRVVDTPLNSSANSYPRLVFEPVLGIRTNILRQKIEVNSVRIGPIPVPFDREFSISRTTFEPLIGGRVGVDLSDRWSLALRGDVSGFNISAARNLTWNLLAGARYRLSPTTSLQLAYSFSNFLFEDGEGLRRARLNLKQQGLWLSALFEF